MLHSRSSKRGICVCKAWPSGGKNWMRIFGLTTRCMAASREQKMRLSDQADRLLVGGAHAPKLIAQRSFLPRHNLIRDALNQCFSIRITRDHAIAADTSILRHGTGDAGSPFVVVA